MRTSSTLLLLLLSVTVAVTVSCKEKTADKPVAVIDAGAATTPGAALPIADQLANEARSRPQIPLTAEKVFSAISGAGMTTANERQVIARNVGARYCRNAHIPDYTMILVVCEYPTPQDATRGREAALAKYKVANSEIFVNGATTLTIANKRGVMPSADEWGKKAIEAFQGLK